MNHLADVKQLIEMGYLSYPGGGLDIRMAESAIATAIALDYPDAPGRAGEAQES